MTTLPSVLSQAFNWCTNFFAGWFTPPTTYTDMSYSSKEGRELSIRAKLFTDEKAVVTADHIQSSAQRGDGTTTLKRQKTRGNGHARSKSVAAVQRKTTGGPIDLEGIKDESEIRRRQDAYWEPPPFSFGSTVRKAPKVCDSKPDELEQRGLDESLQQLHLGPAASPLTPSSSSSSRGLASEIESFTPSRSTYRAPGTPESLPRNSVRPSRSTGSLGLVDRLKFLLVGDKEDPLFQPSEYKKVELAVLKKERERQAIEAARQAARERRLRRQFPLAPLIQQLQPKWDDVVNQIIYSRDPQRVLTKSLEGTELRLKDFNTLLGNGAWLNDEIINTYIEWVVTAANKAADAEAKTSGDPVTTVPKFLAHNSFFYNNLSAKGPSTVERLMKRKKVPGASLLEVDTVFIPVNKGNHWTIGIVRGEARTIEYLDSMGGRGEDVIRHLHGWVKHQLGTKYDEKEWSIPRTACAYQSNGYDCGVFVCTNAFCVAMGLDTSCYHERDLIQQRKNIAAVLINRGFVGDFMWNSGGMLP